MVDIVTRLGKGSPLTNAEVDANFTNLAEVSGVTGEPMGHEDRTTSTISFNASTRTFTIAPTASSFTVWCKGKKVVVSSAQTVVIPNTTGMHSIYYDANGTLSSKLGYFTFSTEAPTAYVYWNATTGAAPYFGDERHGVVLDWQTHEYLHRTRGAALASGFSASGYVLGGNGSSNSHAQITLEGGTFFDEDMKIIVTATNTPTAGTWEQDLTSPARIPVLYLSGTAWVIDAPTDYPLKQGTARPQYNAFSGGVWSTADVANNKYATSWILATNNLTYPVIAIIGQAESDLQSAAEAVDFTALQLPGFPSVEFRPLYKLIFQCADSCTNAVHASLVSITDIRSIAAAGTAASIVTDHGNLSGLSDDDHPQYLSVDTVRGSLTAAVKASFLPSQTSNDGKFLQTNGTATSWAALSSSNVTTALGFTPYNATNPSGFITGITSGNVTTALGFTPYNATNPSGYVTAAGARGAISVTGAGSYDSATGVINIVGGVTSFNTRTGAITLSSADVTTALGFTPYNNTNPSGYITGITSTMVTTALGFTPYNSSNPNGYISSITSANVTTALGFTPYDNSNPSGYITSSALSGYLTSASAASTYLPLAGGTVTGKVTFPSATANQPQMPNGFLGLDTGDANFDIWGISRDYYPSHATAANAWGIRWDGDSNQIRFIGGGNVRLAFDLDDGTTQINSNTVLHAGNYNSYALPLSGGTISGALTINGGSSYPLQVNSTQRYIAWFRNTSVAGAGWWLANDANTLVFHADSSGDKASLNTDGVFITTNSFRAPLFYDSDNTAYYVDPASTSKLSILEVGTGPGGSNAGNLYIKGNNSFRWIAGYAPDYGVGNGFGLYSDSLGAYYASLSTSGNWYFGVNDHSSSYRVSINGTGYATSDLRAPIFYDSNDTAYYVDPNSNSRLSSISVPAGSPGFVNAARGSYFGYSSGYGTLIYGVTSGAVTPCFNVDPISNVSGSFNGNGNEVMFRNGVQFISPNSSNNGYNNYFVLQDGYVAANNSLRAPIFYDTNDSGYYLDPAGSSLSASLNGPIVMASTGWTGEVSGKIQYHASSWYLVASGYFHFRNTSGLNTFYGDSSGNTWSEASSRAPIFYDSNNTSYYVDPASATSGSFAGFVGIGNNYGSDDGGWGSRLNVGGGPHARLDVRCANDGIITTMFSHTGNGVGKIGMMSNHPLVLMAQAGSTGGYVYSGSIRSPIFYDSDNTAYFTDPAGRSRQSQIDFGDGSYYIHGGDWGMRNTTPYGWIQFGPANSSHAHVYTDRSNFYFNAQIQVNGGSQINTSDIRANIYYDNNNTGYYVDPNGTTRLAGLVVGYANANSTIDMYDSDEGTRYIHNNSGTIGFLNSSGSWRFRVADDGNVIMGTYQDYLSNQIRSAIFYDHNDTGYYTDPNNTSRLNTTVTNLSYLGVDANKGYAQGYGTYSSQLHKIARITFDWDSNYNQQEHGIFSTDINGSYSDSMSLNSFNDINLRVDSNNNDTASYVRFHHHSTGSNQFAYVGYDGSQFTAFFSGILYGSSSARAPIFYDYDNTGYYVDPASSSVLNQTTIAYNYGNFEFAASSNSSTSYSEAAIEIRETNRGGSGSWLAPRLAFHWGGVVASQISVESSGRIAILNNPGTGYENLVASITYGSASVRAPIFYDSDNTGYYVDPNGSSYLYGMVLSGSMYFRPNTWIQMDSSAGIYWPNHYGAHLYPNISTTYTQLQIDGQKNGYSGMHISHSGVQGMMYDGSGNGGVYREANGRWYFYHNIANNCMGVGTSSTNPAFGIYVTKGGYFDGRVDGTIFYDANNTTYYVDPNDTGTSVRVAGNVTAYYSDMRLKTHLGKIENALDKVKQLEGFYYEANETAQKLGYKPKREVGVSAQDVQAVLPEIVTDAPINSNYLTIDYERLTPLLIEAIKEQDTELVDLRNRVAQLESLINKLIGD